MKKNITMNRLTNNSSNNNSNNNNNNYNNNSNSNNSSNHEDHSNPHSDHNNLSPLVHNNPDNLLLNVNNLYPNVPNSPADPSSDLHLHANPFLPAGPTLLLRPIREYSRTLGTRWAGLSVTPSARRTR